MEGQGILCFPEDATWFQGYFMPLEFKSQMGILATEVPIDDCVRCPSGGYKEFTVTLIDFDTDEEMTVQVCRTGGDFCQLLSDQVEFNTESLFTEKKAAAAIEKYFPSILNRGKGSTELHRCIICIGRMKVTRI